MLTNVEPVLPKIPNLSVSSFVFFDFQFDVCDEAALLLAKLHFTEGNLSACFDIYKQISLPRLKVDALMYKKKIFYEAFAIKGTFLLWSALCNLRKSNVGL